ncbi:MAG TPA: dihydrodipicolinate synthase family protein [Terracidiphilus sp.]|jgi:4-hydroxy-2-oxoglutarate aldolase|nr:dihydrodipicolinate synthase family protein [Terracidiphilus sp.]
MLIEGVYAAVTTPFYPDERIYFRKIEANMARYSRSLLAGMVVLGSTGEAVMLDDAEARDVLQASAEASAPEKVLIAGVGRESVGATVALAESAAESRYDAILVRPPSYYAGQLTKAAVLNYFRSVADHSPLPVVLYNIPKCVPYQIPIEVIAELAEHPGIIGIKDSSGSVERIEATVEATRNAPRRTVTVTPIFEAVTERMLKQAAVPDGTFVRAGDLSGGGEARGGGMAAVAPNKTRSREVGFQVLCGAGSVVLPSLEAGACGAILAFGACAPQVCQEIYLAWKDHDRKLATEKQQRIAAANNRIVGSLGIAGVKYACDFNGFYGGRPRSPLLGLTAEEKVEVEGLLAEIRN